MRHVQATLERQHAECLFRQQRVHDEALLQFASNDYLGLARDPALQAAFHEGIDRFGVGSGASAMVCGYSAAHQECEAYVAAWLGRDEALLVNSGYHANLGVIPALASRDSHIIADRLCHASIIDGIRLSGAHYTRYHHGDASHLQSILSTTRRPAMVITESLFSMEGDIAPLLAIVKECTTHSALLMVDDAHGIGVMGSQGRGICEYYGLSQKDVPLLVLPLGKAVGCIGAIIAGSRDLISMIRQLSRPYMYSTALPPALAYTITHAFRLIERDTWRRDALHARIADFQALAQQQGIPLCSGDATPIQSIVLGSPEKALAMQASIAAQGMNVACIRPPTVPEGTARLRISLSALHSTADIRRLIEAMSECYHG